MEREEWRKGFLEMRELEEGNLEMEERGKWRKGTRELGRLEERLKKKRKVEEGDDEKRK